MKRQRNAVTPALVTSGARWATTGAAAKRLQGQAAGCMSGAWPTELVGVLA